MLQLKKLDTTMEKAFEEYLTDWQEEKIIPTATDKKGQPFQEILDNFKRMETDPPRLLVPSTTLFLVNEQDKILGAIDIRHFLNDGLLKTGGHIGYGVCPSCRGKGYAKQMVMLAQAYLKTLQLNKVLICCDKTNLASAKTILACNGVLENEVVTFENGKEKVMQRYWVEIN